MNVSDVASVKQLRALIADDSDLVFFTGAGVSTESGIADFRSPGGIWSQIKPIQFKDFLSSEDQRMEDWRRRFIFQKHFDEAKPNAAHTIIGDLLQSDRALGVITQNIDGLHQRGGAAEQDVVEIHGNGTKAACLDCGQNWSLDQAKKHIDATGTSPLCTKCGGIVKANIISFGQPMPERAMNQALDLALKARVFIVLGSSLVVNPAATIPAIAKQNGAKLAIVNNENTPLDDLADSVVNLAVGQVMTDVFA